MLQKRGFAVNRKSLYRLATPQPVQKIDTTIVRGVCEALDVRLQDLIQFQKPKFELKRLDPRSQRELDRLMDKNNQGGLTKTEQTLFKARLEEVQKVFLYNSRMLAQQKRLRESKHFQMGREPILPSKNSRALRRRARSPRQEQPCRTG
ncbi:MAG: hypothetical protein WAM44_13335, partial [Chthoniobacterales bacterium]